MVHKVKQVSRYQQRKLLYKCPVLIYMAPKTFNIMSMYSMYKDVMISQTFNI